MQHMTLTLGLAGLLTGAAAGQLEKASFDAPIEITAGGKKFSSTIYPTPVLVDIDGDGQNELVIGDLRGYIVSAERTSGDPASGWGEATNVQADGKPLKLNNW